LFGKGLDHGDKLFDPNLVLRHKLKIITGRGTGTLSALCQKFLGFTLDKQLAHSKWSAPALSLSQVSYGLRDAYASAEIASAVYFLLSTY
jgi:ribonuclease D